MSRKPRKTVPLTTEKNIGDSSRSEKEHVDQVLDEALIETFPASDPIAVSVTSVPYNAKRHRQAQYRR